MDCDENNWFRCGDIFYCRLDLNILSVILFLKIYHKVENLSSNCHRIWRPDPKNASWADRDDGIRDNPYSRGRLLLLHCWLG